MTLPRTLALGSAAVVLLLVIAALSRPPVTQTDLDARRGDPAAGSPSAVAPVADGLLRTLLAGRTEREVVLTEAEINQRIRSQLESSPGSIPVQDVTLRLGSRGKVDLAGTAQLSGRETPIEATVTIGSRGSTLDIEVESATAGGMALPPVLADRLAEEAVRAAGFSGLKGNQLPDDIASVTVQDGKLVITRK